MTTAQWEQGLDLCYNMNKHQNQNNQNVPNKNLTRIIEL